ncbi:MAG: hypothetical protein D6780_06255 [Candidatus Dadabacteria bacterium]|nr:MAG: hypothetical protein D6780_06255 [Candidatus Dadabacteria bacterium]
MRPYHPSPQGEGRFFPHLPSPLESHPKALVCFRLTRERREVGQASFPPAAGRRSFWCLSAA